jgi:hypothetical protein
MRGPTMGETIELMKKCKSNEPWKEEMENWTGKMKQAKLAACKASFDLRLEHAKPRLKAARRLTIEVFTNRPGEDQIADRWKMMIKVKPSYTIKEVYQKVKTRWKDRWKIEWSEELVDNMKTRGRKGRTWR